MRGARLWQGQCLVIELCSRPRGVATLRRSPRTFTDAARWLCAQTQQGAICTLHPLSTWPPVPLPSSLALIPPAAAVGVMASAAATAPAREDTHRLGSSSGRPVDADRQPCAFLPGIQLIVGPMFAGKTSELLRRAAELEVRRSKKFIHELESFALHCVQRSPSMHAETRQVVACCTAARTAGSDREVPQGHALPHAAGRHARRRLEGTKRQSRYTVSIAHALGAGVCQRPHPLIDVFPSSS